MQIFLRFSNVESIVYVGVWIDSVADESFLLFVSCYLACWFENHVGSIGSLLAIDFNTIR